MGKMNKSAIEETIKYKLKENYRTLLTGVDMGKVTELLSISAFLNEPYQGECNYTFNGKVELNENISEGNTISISYRFSNSLVHIKEGESGAEVSLAGPIFLTKV